MDKLKQQLKELFGKINNIDPSKLRLNAHGHWRNIIVFFVLGVFGVVAFSYYVFFTHFDRNIIGLPDEYGVSQTDVGKYRNIEAGLKQTIERYEVKQNKFNSLLFEKPEGFVDPARGGAVETVGKPEDESADEEGENEETAEETVGGGLRYQTGQMGAVFQSLIDWLR